MVDVYPEAGRLAMFYSADCPHEVQLNLQNESHHHHHTTPNRDTGPYPTLSVGVSYLGRPTRHHHLVL